MKRVILGYQDSRGWKHTVKEAADERAFSMYEDTIYGTWCDWDDEYFEYGIDLEGDIHLVSKVPLEDVEDAVDVVEAVEAIFKNIKTI